MKRSLRATNAVLAEKQNLIEKSGEAAAGGTSPRAQKDELYLVRKQVFYAVTYFLIMPRCFIFCWDKNHRLI
jgi:hypothetical protein